MVTYNWRRRDRVRENKAQFGGLSLVSACTPTPTPSSPVPRGSHVPAPLRRVLMSATYIHSLVAGLYCSTVLRHCLEAPS